MRYIVRKFVEAKSAEEARKKSLRIPIHEIYIDDRYWEKSGFNMGEDNTIKGFNANNGRKQAKSTK